MANELPYFRFTVQAWQNGDISLESYEMKGFFIDVCGYYWIKDCSITLAMLQKKFSNDTMILELIELGIIKHENKHDKINIDYLNKQYDMLSEKRKRRQAAGSKGGNAKAKVKQKASYKDKDKDKDKDKNKEEKDIPTLSTFLDYIKEVKPDKYLAIQNAAGLKYQSWKANEWKDGNDKKITNWKTKILNTIPYLKEEEVAKHTRYGIGGLL
tara:strand:+ start:297 stop:932 length:636 start_codon:yes stop_codon:yes gene_type:complete